MKNDSFVQVSHKQEEPRIVTGAIPQSYLIIMLNVMLLTNVRQMGLYS
uniref:Uncharacterized protein n=1 Tax=Siphoviridae sp. ct8NQ14 TaxID=2825363 RepID=A0A8S5PNP1_9CAUD|nr:MAG TPA: hypothetical protein [Siphoviridae sp. ct8NQ14]